jgi:hypothetical protein
MLDRLHALESRLAAELDACRSGIGIIGEQSQASRQELEVPHGDLSRLASYYEKRTALSSSLLIEPIRRIEQMRPLKRALSALEAYYDDREELLRQLPESMELSGAVAATILKGTETSDLHLRVARLRRRPRRLSMQVVVRAEFARSDRLRLKLQGRYIVALLAALRGVLRISDSSRRRLDRSIAGKLRGHVPGAEERETSGMYH